MSEAFQTLPLAGGLFDQPAGYIARMEAVLRATNDHENTTVKNKREAQERADKKLKEMKKSGVRS